MDYSKKENMLRVGVITGAHGIKGEVKVYPTTDDPRRFKKLASVWLDDGKTLTCRRVLGARSSKNMILLALEGIEDRDVAQALKKTELLISREDAVKLEEDEYFITDLIGLEVMDEKTGDRIGILREVIPTGANDAYEIELDQDFRYEGAKPSASRIYIPAIKECIVSVDMEGRKMVINIMKGLIDL